MKENDPATIEEIEKNLALCAAIRSAFPDSVKEGFYREACAKNPENPKKAYCEGLLQDRHFFDHIVREPVDQ